jgi:hypothetical protein
MARIDADIYVLSYRGTFDGSCTGPDGKLKIPSPIRAATVWIRAGGTWRAAFHGQDPIFDAKNPPLPATAESKKETKKDDKAVPSANIAADPSTSSHDGGRKERLGSLESKGCQEARRTDDSRPFVPKHIGRLFC